MDSPEVKLPDQSNPRKRLRGHRRTERAAVNSLRALLESFGLIVQEVEGSNDYGKDLIVDLTAEDDEITGEVIAFQVKGGNSFKSGESWFIPASKTDVRLWRDSSVPIYGAVHDPDNNILRWTNLPDFARGERLPKLEYQQGKQVEVPFKIGSRVEIDSDSVLSDQTIDKFLRSARNYLARSATSSFLALWGSDEDAGAAAVFDCFAVGRTDARALIMLRYAISTMKGYALHDAIHALSHVTPHPDIFWSKDNWIPTKIKETHEPGPRW